MIRKPINYLYCLFFFILANFLGIYHLQSREETYYQEKTPIRKNSYKERPKDYPYKREYYHSKEYIHEKKKYQYYKGELRAIMNKRDPPKKTR